MIDRLTLKRMLGKNTNVKSQENERRELTSVRSDVHYRFHLKSKMGGEGSMLPIYSGRPCKSHIKACVW